MSDKLVIDYSLTKVKVANPDGSHKATDVGCSTVTDAGATPYGTFGSALSFKSGSSIRVPLAISDVDATQFDARVIFKLTNPVAAREVLLTSDVVPFSISVQPAKSDSTFELVCAVNNVNNGWSETSSLARINLKLHQWYAVDLLYDTDTLGLLINKTMIAVSAFPIGALAATPAGELVIGVDLDHTSHQFLGHMAEVRLYSGIQPDLNAMLEAARGNPEWFIRLKQHQIADAVGLGNPVGDIGLNSAGMDVQQFDSGLIAYATGYPSAFEMHGPIWQRYISANLESVLGALVSDEEACRA